MPSSLETSHEIRTASNHDFQAALKAAAAMGVYADAGRSSGTGGSRAATTGGGVAAGVPAQPRLLVETQRLG